MKDSKCIGNVAGGMSGNVWDSRYPFVTVMACTHGYAMGYILVISEEVKKCKGGAGLGSH